MRARRVQICNIPGEFEQVVGEPHLLCNGPLIEFGLFGLAAEVEIRKDLPSFQRVNLFGDGC